MSPLWIGRGNAEGRGKVFPGVGARERSLESGRGLPHSTWGRRYGVRQTSGALLWRGTGDGRGVRRDGCRKAAGGCRTPQGP
jgi:hypothetical protein